MRASGVVAVPSAEPALLAQTPLFRFGEGLSLTTFNISCSPAMMQDQTDTNAAAAAPPTPSPPLPIYRRIIVTCTVTNTGTMVGDEVLQVYHAAGDEVRAAASKLHPVPLKQLVEFERFIDLAPGKAQSVTMSLDPDAVLALTAANGSKVVYPGEHKLIFSTGVPAVPDVVQTVAVQ